jgi:SAM-dependent methyltransferase
VTDAPLLIYDELAPWWPLLSAPADYEEEATYYADALNEHAEREPRTLLELGSGGGNNASFLKHRFERLTLVDRSPGMLDVSRALNPECEHVIGDMRSVRLGRRFDCVFVHDAICYATTTADLQAVIETAHAHCEVGGAALFAPDFVRENFGPSTEHGGEDGSDGRGLRFVGWVWDPDPEDETYVVDYALILKESDGTARARHDRHLEGLFATHAWVDILRRASFRPHVLWHRHTGEDIDRVVFVGTREADTVGERTGA